MATAKPAKKIFPIKTFIADLPTSHIFNSNVQTPQFTAKNASVNLNKNLDPSDEPASQRPGRLVIIGDVHGMKKSLDSLLQKINFNKDAGDHLILAGDLVNKGPDSVGVVDLAIKLGASAVRGNHDNAVLHAAAQINAKRVTLVQAGVLLANASASDTITDSDGDGNIKNNGGDADTTLSDKRESRSLDTPTGTLIGDIQNFQKHASAGPDDVEHGLSTYTTALALSRRQLDWLAELPLILRVELPPPSPLTSSNSLLGEKLVVVHAGLVPDIPLQDQDPHSIMHMRSLRREVLGEEVPAPASESASASGTEPQFLPTEEFGEEGWAKAWDSWQEKQEIKTTVVFGHDAKRRLQLGKYSIGLDSACLYGHRLSALVVSACATSGQITHEVVQVDCCDAFVAPTAQQVKESMQANKDLSEK